MAAVRTGPTPSAEASVLPCERGTLRTLGEARPLREQPWVAGTTTMNERLMVGGSVQLLRRACAALFVVATLASCGSPARTTSPSETTPTANVDPRAVAAEIDDRLMTHLRSNAAGAYDNVRAVLVTVGGQPAVERYFHSSPGTGENVHSVTKSVGSASCGTRCAAPAMTSAATRPPG